MSEPGYNPTEDPRVRLTIEAYRHKDSEAGRAVIALLRHSYEAAKEGLVTSGRHSRAIPGEFVHLQGQAHALGRLLDDMENGPAELRALNTDEDPS